MTTGGMNSGTAITLDNSYGYFGTFVAQSDFTNVTFRGDDGYAHQGYWTTCVQVSNVSDITFQNANFYGTSDADKGTGITFDNPGAGCFAAPITCGTVYNIANSNFSFLGTGIRYGANTQTVQIMNTLFAQNSTAIYVPPNGGTLQGLSINNSTFFSGASGDVIYITSALPNLIITNNLINVHAGHRGIALDIADNTTISGNQFVPDKDPNTAVSGVDIRATVPGSVSVIDGNTFSSVANGIRLFTQTAKVRVGAGNNFTGNITNVTDLGVGNVLP